MPLLFYPIKFSLRVSPSASGFEKFEDAYQKINIAGPKQHP
jgi:hypothetical protein